jgi:uncharacterized membrane protein YjjP (DUF1212 family)
MIKVGIIIGMMILTFVVYYLSDDVWIVFGITGFVVIIGFIIYSFIESKKNKKG